MWLLLVEAGGAMMVLVGIVWWTMFSGPKPPPHTGRDEQRAPNSPAQADQTDPKP